MDEHRIYKEKIDIDTKRVREFYEKRARVLEQSDGKGKSVRYATVTFTEENAEKWDVMEKDLILHILNIQETDSVLDIGCGIGRWAETVIPLCRRYVGADFSEEMIKFCKENFCDWNLKGKDVSFLNMSFQELLRSDQFKGKPFDVVLIAGVSMYINDDDLKQCFSQLASLLSKGGRLYLWESIGLGRRLTLDEIWSSALDSNYSAIYRTREEYLNLLQPLLSVSDMVEERIVSEFDHGKNSDTSRWFAVMKKKMI